MGWTTLYIPPVPVVQLSSTVSFRQAPVVSRLGGVRQKGGGMGLKAVGKEWDRLWPTCTGMMRMIDTKREDFKNVNEAQYCFPDVIWSPLQQLDELGVYIYMVLQHYAIPLFRFCKMWYLPTASYSWIWNVANPYSDTLLPGTPIWTMVYLERCIDAT